MLIAFHRSDVSSEAGRADHLRRARPARTTMPLRQRSALPPIPSPSAVSAAETLTRAPY